MPTDNPSDRLTVPNKSPDTGNEGGLTHGDSPEEQRP